MKYLFVDQNSPEKIINTLDRPRSKSRQLILLFFEQRFVLIWFGNKILLHLLLDHVKGEERTGRADLSITSQKLFLLDGKSLASVMLK